ncbi:MAG: DUF4340 domain-containing protein [Candidatus Acidiferrales bacterium]|jgi:hypothetical protein
MIKKPTLIILICAVALGAAVYFFDWKRGNEKKPVDASQPAFSFAASDVASFTLAHPANRGDTPIRFEKRSGIWEIVQPIETQADQATAEGIVDQLAGARIAQTEPGGADRRKVYGLDPPSTSLEFQLQNGSKHTLLIGSKDFTETSIYTVVDGGQSVALLPQTLSISTSKSLEELRDRTVLYVDAASVASLSLKNSSGELAAAREKEGWKFTEPSGPGADKDSIDSLLSALAAARMTSIASEKPENLSKYGLATPAVTFTAVDEKGQKFTLLVGKKDGDDYFARDPSRPMIFRINEDLDKKLSEGPGDFRDKQVIHLDAADIQRVEIHNANGDIVVSSAKDKPGQWTVEAPEAEKGKSAAGWRVLDPFTGLRAENVIDRPAASLTAQLTHPALRAVLTDTNGKTVTLRISKPSGDFVYAQGSDSPSLYKLKKQALDDLNFKPADLIL